MSVSLARLFCLAALLVATTATLGRADSAFGPRSCIASIADLDGDGMRDVLVAQRTHGQRECVWAISSKSGAILFRVQSDKLGDGFGWSLAELGDVNGDRAPDFVVGATGSHVEIVDFGSGQSMRYEPVSGGYARVFSGKDGATIRDLRTGWNTHLGSFCVANAGRVNGDDVCDVLVADMNADWAAGTPVERSRAVVRVYSGSDGALLHVLTTPEGRDATYDCFGAAMIALGDLDRDGHGDFAIAAPTARAAPTDAERARGDVRTPGCVYVISGLSGKCMRVLTGESCDQGFGWSLAAASDPASPGQILLAAVCPSRTVTLFSSKDWQSRVLATAHAKTHYLDEFGASLEFALDRKTSHPTALVIGANEICEAVFDEGYAEAYPIASGEPLVLTSREREGIDVCALDDLDGDGRNEYAFVGVKSMRLRIASGMSGETLREVALGPAGVKPK